MDLLRRQAEAPALEKICTLIGHEVTTFEVRSKAEFWTICKFISSIDDKDDVRGARPVCVHVATHGNADELGFGYDTVTWEELLDAIEPLCSEMHNYKGELILVISACEAANQTLTERLARRARSDRKFKPPLYLFITTGETPSFADTVVSWTVFYHQFPNSSLDDRKSIQEVLARVRSAGATTLTYYRWHKAEKRYRRHTPAMK